jgi:tRNA 2-thiouridine synthesizing protein A
MSQRKTIDARGSFCPGPLMELISAIKLVDIGDEIEILSSDQGSAKDIPAWVEKVKHEVVSTEEKSGVWSIVVRKAK